MIRNHAQSGSGHSLCLGEKDASEGMDISVIHWVWWLRNKKRICRENRKMQKIHFPLNLTFASLSLSFGRARAKSCQSFKKNEEEEKDG